jgi:HlyD family secretion protein
MVDIKRNTHPLRRLILRVIFLLAALGVIGGITWFVYGLKPADPTVERANILIDTVKRGPMSREVRGIGKLVPEEVSWVPVAADGRVIKKLLEAGAHVQPDTVLIELSNPQLEQETLMAEWEWKSAKTSYADSKLRLESQQLTQESDISNLESQCQQAELEYQAKAKLAADGLFTTLELKKLKAAADQQRNRLTVEQKKALISKESNLAQIALQQTKIEQAKAAYDLKKSRLDHLKVRAGISGVLQQIAVELGEQISSGSKLAKVANPNKLKAELSIAETQAKYIQLGQDVSIDTHPSIISGKVARIDPAVGKDGMVIVDISLTGNLPEGMRPDLSVEGIIVLEKMDDVVYVGHPGNGQPDSQISLFKLTPDGNRAIRVPVKLGRSSVSNIEIKEGLKPGDQVILSEVSQYDDADSIRLK